jgi:putative hemolysin
VGQARRPAAGGDRHVERPGGLLSRSTDLVVRLAGGDPSVQRQQVTNEEVRDLVATQPTFTPQQRTILIGTVEIAERHLSDVLVPRRDVVALSATMPVNEAIDTLVATTHSGAPVYRRDLDEVIGVAHLTDLINAEGQVASKVRPAVVLPESMWVLDALRRLQAKRPQLGLVIDEYGGTRGDRDRGRPAGGAGRGDL